MLYVEELYKAIVVDDLTNVPNSESVWYKLTSTKSSLIIGVCYHSTSASVVYEVALHNVIEQACHRYKNVVICGDLSHITIDWDLLQCNSEGQKFLDLTLDCFLHQHVDEPTRGENILKNSKIAKKQELRNYVISVCYPISTFYMFYPFIFVMNFFFLHLDINGCAKYRLQQAEEYWNELSSVT